MQAVVTSKPVSNIPHAIKPNLNSDVLKRLMNEVRVEEPDFRANRYDRVHNRHNR